MLTGFQQDARVPSYQNRSEIACSQLKMGFRKQPRSLKSMHPNETRLSDETKEPNACPVVDKPCRWLKNGSGKPKDLLKLSSTPFSVIGSVVTPHRAAMVSTQGRGLLSALRNQDKASLITVT